ncbi:hypothetical protein IAD21_03833 [Abditibacteriota bacterium]|nr:hypothetical protein IAD21_03833 [Abditibacteriota bacterium]
MFYLPARGDDAKAAGITEGAAVALGIADAPQGRLFEAEDYSAGDIVEVAGASGGKAVKSDHDWQPLIAVPLPDGDAWRLWIRYKGGPLAIKTKDGDHWFWNKPDHFSWTEVDVFSREDLGGKTLRIGRDAGGVKADTAQIDAVVLAPEKKRELPPDRPDPAKAPQKLTASIDWSKIVGGVPPMLWGINEQQVLSSEGSSDPVYQKLLGELKTPLIRVHQADFTEALTNAELRDWDVPKLKKNFANSTGYGDARVMLNIAYVPSWLAPDATQMSEAQEDEFAALCAHLVRVMREDVKHPVSYWEVTNEWDNTFEKAGKMDKLWRIYNKCAAAMRKEDPKARIGGLAFTWANAKWINGFLDNCKDIDFISWHNYGTGDLYETNEKIFAGTSSNAGNLAQGVLDTLKAHGRADIETFLTETNVKYTWDPYERRHQNQVGSIFHALVVKKMAEIGISGVTLWTQKGRAYGSLIDDKDQTLPSYTLYQWGPQYLNGKMVSATSGDETLLEILPVIGPGNQKSVLLVNKADHALILPSAATLLPGKTHISCMSADGLNVDGESKSDGLTLPGYSLTLLTAA